MLQSVLDGFAAVMLIITTLMEDDDGRHLEGLWDEVYCRVWASKVSINMLLLLH